MNILILMAMKEEATPVIDQLNFQFKHKIEPYPFEFYQTSYSNHQLILGLCGEDPQFKVQSVGYPSAALLAEKMISKERPDLIISAGTSGGYESQGTEIGDVFLSHQKICFHDRIITLPQYDQYGVGSYPCMDTNELAKKCNLKQGIVSTGNSLPLFKEQAEVMTQNQANVKEMEAAAIAYVANLYQVPFLAVKSVTDWVDHHEESAEQFLKNLALATEKLKDSLTLVLKEL